jgi:ribosomal protein S27AE
MRQATCPQCSTIFRTISKTHRYCTFKCKQQAKDQRRAGRLRPRPPRHCPDCGTTLPQEHGNRRRCGPCAQIHHDKQRGRGTLDLTCYVISDKTTRIATAAYIASIQRDPCGFCGQQGGVIDHIIPKGNQGPNTWDNYSGLCVPCNSRKQRHNLLTALARHGIRAEIDEHAKEWQAWTGQALNLMRG